MLSNYLFVSFSQKQNKNNKKEKRMKKKRQSWQYRAKYEAPARKYDIQNSYLSKVNKPISLWSFSDKQFFLVVVVVTG